MKQYLKQLARRKDLVLYLVTSGLKAQHRNTFLGYIWWLLDPLLGLAIYYFVIGVVFGRGGPEYLIHLVIGLSVWRWFQTSVTAAAKSITSKAGIISQVYIPKVILPGSAVASQVVNFGFGLIVMALFIVGLWQVPGVAILWLPFLVLVLFLFIMALALPIAYLSVFIRDMDNLVNHLLRIWFYASPVIWSADTISERWHWLIGLNPMALLLTSFNDVLMYNRTPNVLGLLLIGFGSCAAIMYTTYYYSRNEHRLIKVL